MAHNAGESSELLPVYSHRRRSLSRALQGQGIQTVARDAEEPSDLLPVHSHRRHGLSKAVRGQGISPLTHRCRGVQLLISRAFTSEPQSSSSRAMSTCTHRDAMRNGMKQSSPWELTSEPRSIRRCAMSGFPYRQESSSGVSYCLSRASRLAPDPSKRPAISQYPDCAAVDEH